MVDGEKSNLIFRRPPPSYNSIIFFTMKVLHISDTHGFHDQLSIDNDVDMIIHSGDFSNSREVLENRREAQEFFDWFLNLNIKHKILIAGNHDVIVEKDPIFTKAYLNKDVIYLENDWVIIEGLKIFGSPITPTFGTGWAFNKGSTIKNYWEHIPEDTDILITHGPPKGFLDLTINRQNQLELCGCPHLRNKVKEIEPRYMMFGHIHNCKKIINSGTLQIAGLKTIFSNGSCVTDNRFDLGITSHGNYFEIN
jgi:Icc-related predicted phosphoesterase